MMTNFPRPRRFRDNLGMMLIDGESSMGKYRLPPMPPRIALTDNQTGQIKVLSHNNPLTGVVLATPQNNWPDLHIYEPNDGPSRYGWTLILSNGVLSFIQNIGAHGPAIFTRRAFDKTVIQIEPWLVDGQIMTMTTDLTVPDDYENRVRDIQWRPVDASVSFPSLDNIRITSLTNGINPKIIKGPVMVSPNFDYDYHLHVKAGTQSGNMILRVSTSPTVPSGQDNTSATTTTLSNTYSPASVTSVWIAFIATCSTAGQYADCDIKLIFKED